MGRTDDAVIVSTAPAPGGEPLYLVRWPRAARPDERFSWEPSSRFAARPDIVAAFWRHRSPLLRDAQTQTCGFALPARSPPPLRSCDLFCGASAPPSRSDSAASQDHSLIPTRILRMDVCSHSEAQFLCTFDGLGLSEKWVSQSYVLSLSPKLLAEFLIEAKRRGIDRPNGDSQ